jgi:hypothetical protein
MPATHEVLVAARRLAGNVVLAGSTLTVIGVVLPWVELRRPFVHQIVSGVETNPGKIALAAAIFAALLTFVARTTRDDDGQRIFQALSVLPAAAITFLAAYNLLDVKSVHRPRFRESVDVGVGLWVTLAGGLLAFAGGVLGVRAAIERETPVDGPAPPFWFPGSFPTTGEH